MLGGAGTRQGGEANKMTLWNGDKMEGEET